MKILHISTRLILGGSQENTILSCEGQARLGHEVHLAFGPIYGPEGSLLDRVESFNRTASRPTPSTSTPSSSMPGCLDASMPAGSGPSAITTHVVPNLIRDVDPVRDRRALRELESLIRALKPDIVHTHSSKAGILGRVAAWRVRRAARADRPAIVHTIHGPPFMPIEGRAAQRLKVRAMNTAYELAERHAARRCDTIVSVADAMTRQFLARSIGQPEQYTTVYSGMEADAFLAPAPGESRGEIRATLGLPPEAIVVGTVARLAQHKGHDDLLDALAGDLRARPGLTLLWVGDGWWRPRLVDKARSLGLAVRELDRADEDHAGDERREATRIPRIAPPATDAALHDSAATSSSHTSPLRHSPTPPLPLSVSPSLPHLVLTGLVPPQRVPAMIRAMDILAHPSAREGLPRTVPQALLCGVAPVAYDCDGTGEACIDGVTGRLVPTGDRAALRRAILDLADDRAERTRLAERGRELCRARFDARAMVDHLERVYAEALERAARGS